MNIKRIFKSMIFHTTKLIILKPISYLNHRLYMKLYIPLLKNNGMKIIGNPRYIGIHVKFDDFDKISLGDRVVISDGCILLTHDYSLTTALIAINKNPKSDIALIRNISVGNNVFIGKNTIIMPHTQIGDNVIVGAGSVVRGKIADNSVLIGNPAQVVANIQEQAYKWEKYLETDNIRKDKK